ncbi:MAG: ubiquinone-binding protein [Rhodospirillaceae bacterium]|nr:ubiquinone-binding protein [Rhodospirillaceae bacterium]|tara:strand:- start:25230 stop:25667 length:438 start_codon:yes stop_codon:yes gene_type:complete
MPEHSERRLLPYSAEQLFNLVSDVERYPEFLPWCVGARISQREENTFHADLMVGFKLVREVYTSKVVLERHSFINVEYQKGPFKHLINYWKFNEQENGCELEFFIDFEFRSRMLKGIIGPFFGEAINRMVGAFEERASVIYGDKS